MEGLKTFAVIEFPGTLRDANDPRKAIAALGGENAVRTSVTLPFADTAPRLSLNLRPGVDNSGSNIVAEKAVSANNLFLLKVTEAACTPLPESRRQEDSLRPSPEHDDKQQEKASNTKIVIVGQVTSLTTFRSLSDFQYHCVRPKVQHAQGESFTQTTRDEDMGLRFTRMQDMSQMEMAGESLFKVLKQYQGSDRNRDPVVQIDRMRPIRFARNSLEYGTADYWFRQFGANTEAREASTQPVRVPGTLGEDRRSDANRLALLSHRVPADIEEVPSGPHESLTPPVVRGRDAFDTLYELIANLFKERPVWIRRALYEHIPEELRKSFKRVICMIAYCFQGPGPFFQAWIRYGYDPRKDSSSRKYQVLEIRCSHPVILYAAVNPHRHGDQSEVKVAGPVKTPARNLLSRLPLQKNNFVQICDITMKEVADFCEKEECVPKFDRKYGFFSKVAYQRLLSTIKTTLLNRSVEEVGKERAEKLVREYKGSTNYSLTKKRRRIRLKHVMKPGMESMPSPTAEHSEGSLTGTQGRGAANEVGTAVNQGEEPEAQNAEHEHDGAEMERATFHDAGEDVNESGKADDLVTGRQRTGIESQEDDLGLVDVEGYQIFGDDSFDDDEDEDDYDGKNTGVGDDDE